MMINTEIGTVNMMIRDVSFGIHLPDQVLKTPLNMRLLLQTGAKSLMVGLGQRQDLKKTIRTGKYVL